GRGYSRTALLWNGSALNRRKELGSSFVAEPRTQRSGVSGPWGQATAYSAALRARLRPNTQPCQSASAAETVGLFALAEGVWEGIGKRMAPREITCSSYGEKVRLRKFVATTPNPNEVNQQEKCLEHLVQINSHAICPSSGRLLLASLFRRSVRVDI